MTSAIVRISPNQFQRKLLLAQSRQTLGVLGRVCYTAVTMQRYKTLLLALLAGLCTVQLAAEVVDGYDNDKPFPAHKVIGNIYFVGTEGLGSFLITTQEGHILINSDYEQTVPMIRASVEKLGFRFADVKILLGSHAHADHMEGDALIKKLTGARVMALEQDVPLLQKLRPRGEPHPIDRVLHDGDEVKLGGVTLVAHLTPGHTRGCTTWTMKVQDGGKSYDVVILGSIGLQRNPNNLGYILVNSKEYPEIVDDYVRSFKVLRSLPCDVFLAAHGRFYLLKDKYAKLGKGGPNPFIDHAGYLAHLDLQEKAFKARLEEQKAAAK
ncbi:MAG: subclass B3 metallo-beta-lactamase [Acidobacteria bacterium]|nr:MAG: subclass B3 metallo-beta-lactamase [Acidobacteriota bacterium]